MITNREVMQSKTYRYLLSKFVITTTYYIYRPFSTPNEASEAVNFLHSVELQTVTVLNYGRLSKNVWTREPSIDNVYLHNIFAVFMPEK